MPLSKHLVIIASVGKGFGRSLAVAFSKALLSKVRAHCEEFYNNSL